MDPEAADPGSSALPPPPPPEFGQTPAASVSSQRLRWAELLLLLAVAFGGIMWRAFLEFTHPSTATQGPGLAQGWTYATFHELTGLALCAYLIYRQGRSFRELGWTWRWYDPTLAVGIMLLGVLAAYAVSCALYFSGHFSYTDRTSHAKVVAHLVGPHLVWGMVVFTVINSFFEEMLARAYLLTEVEFLTGSAGVAVLVSAGFQGTYHLYQGWQAASGVTAGFLVFSLFFVKTRRIGPIILAHVFWDLLLLVGYVYWRSDGAR